jgi:hypothetical protein
VICVAIKFEQQTTLLSISMFSWIQNFGHWNAPCSINIFYQTFLQLLPP